MSALRYIQLNIKSKQESNCKYFESKLFIASSLHHHIHKALPSSCTADTDRVMGCNHDAWLDARRQITVTLGQVTVELS